MSYDTLSEAQLTITVNLYQAILDLLALDINKLTTNLLKIKGRNYSSINFDALHAVLEAARDMQPDQILNLILKIADFVTDTSFELKSMITIRKETKLQKGEYI